MNLNVVHNKSKIRQQIEKIKAYLKSLSIMLRQISNITLII